MQEVIIFIKRYVMKFLVKLLYETGKGKTSPPAKTKSSALPGYLRMTIIL